MYKLVKTPFDQDYSSIKKTNDDGSITFIPFDLNNTDYQKYLEWVAKGNTPEPADE